MNELEHASIEDLNAYSLGQLPAAGAHAVEQHLLNCSDCSQTLLNISARADTFVELLRDSYREARRSEQSGADTESLPPELTEHPRYELVERIGVGGMGNVYLAKHRLMDRLVALKVIHRELVDKPDVVERFRREVQAAAKLAHENIVAAHDADQLDNSHFLIMEYISGIDLARVVNERGPLPLNQACDYVCQAAAGLQHAHDQGMIHRDIKPHNLMLTGDGTVKILDFGLASLSAVKRDSGDTPTSQSDLTSTGAVVGTPDFMSPEQITDARASDARSDVYGLAATLYYLLAGQPPFPGRNVPEVLQGHVAQAPPLVTQIRPDVPQQLADLICRGLAKDPRQRPTSAAELKQTVEAIISQSSERAQQRSSDRSRAALPIGRWARVAAMLLPALLVVGVAVALYSPSQRGDTNSPDTAAAPRQGAGLAAVDDQTNDTQSADKPPADQQSPVDTTPPEFTRSEIEDTERALSSIQFVEVGGASFEMGTPLNRKATPEEKAHAVTITRSFEMAIHEVTQRQFSLVMGRNPSAFSADGSKADEVDSETTDDLPVENVSWLEAMEFCWRLTELPTTREPGYVYRLPTEAEWELACRAGSTTDFHFGPQLNGKRANINGRHPWGPARPGPFVDQPTPVGSYPANALGLHDMHGNVWEWCSDWYGYNTYQDSPVEDPTGPEAGVRRVVRGGAWNTGAMFARSSSREGREPEFRDESLGFRVVRSRKVVDDR